MYLTASIHVKQTHPLYALLDEYAFLCKNLFNVATYHQRQEFFSKHQMFNAFTLINQFTQEKQSDYKAIPAKIAQQIVKQVAQNFQSFWASIRAYRQDKSKFKSNPKLPKYLHKTKGRANIILTKQAVSKRDWNKGILTLSIYFDTPLSFPLGKLQDMIPYEQVQEVKVVRIANGYDIRIAYKVVEPQQKPDNQRYLSVAFGLNNLLTVAGNTECKPFIITGKPVKSVNQYYHKVKSVLQSEKDRLPSRAIAQLTNLNRRMEQLSCFRKNQIHDYLHKASRYLVNHAVSNDISKIVIWYNQNWKQEINIGKVNNQHFVSIPFAQLVSMIQYKAQLQGIEVILTEESYTSKCSFLDNESLKKQASYLGKRVKRGLFRSAGGKTINSDVNGACNILRKVIGNFKFDPIVVCSTPKKINVWQTASC